MEGLPERHGLGHDCASLVRGARSDVTRLGCGNLWECFSSCVVREGSELKLDLSQDTQAVCIRERPPFAKNAKDGPPASWLRPRQPP